MPPLTAKQRQLYAELLVRPGFDVLILNPHWVGIVERSCVASVYRSPEGFSTQGMDRAQRIRLAITSGLEQQIRAYIHPNLSKIRGISHDVIVVDELTDVKDVS